MAYEFMGYVRPDGQVGCRNHVAVMPSVTCAGDVASAIVRQVAGTVGYFHHQGCCQLPPDLDRVTETLISLGKSPNVAAVLVVSLGCEGTDHERLTAEIRKAKQIANGAGMVAINAMVATQDYAAAIRTAVEAGVDAVVSGAGLPLELPGLVDTMEVAIAPIVSSGRAAKLILRRWAKEFGRTADFVVIEGCKAGGHLGFAEQDLFSGTCQTLDEILPEVLAEVKPYEAQFGHSIPVFVAGGVYTGADLAHFTRLGAAGVQLATRFITTYECDASQGYKDVLLNAGSEDVRIIHSPVGMPGRALNTPLVQAMAEGRRFPPRYCARCLKTCDPAKVPYCITHALIEAVKGNLEEGLFFCGANVGRLDRMYTVRELMDELVTEWRQNR